MKILLVSAFLLLSTTAFAQKKPVAPTPAPNPPAEVMRCTTLEHTQDVMKKNGFVKHFMGKIGPKVDLIIWYNESKGVIVNTTMQEIDGVYVMCIAGPPVVRVREFGPV